jgi:hypothetical protein
MIHSSNPQQIHHKYQSNELKSSLNNNNQYLNSNSLNPSNTKINPYSIQ